MIHQRIIKPVLTSQASVEDISWGVAIGLFIGLTPTMGAQMSIVTGVWFVLRFVMQFSFNLPIACAMVWVTNPITLIPMYYAFFTTGGVLLQSANQSNSFAWFESKIQTINNNFSGIELIMKGMEFLLFDIGYPMLVGSLFYAIPVSFVSFFITRYLLTQRRK